MKIKTISYSQFPKETREWSMDALSLGKVNLIVGKNASGKSMTLNVIKGLAELVSGQPLKYVSGNYDVIFEHYDQKIEYSLDYVDKKVTREIYKVDGKTLLDRKAGGIGKIYAEKLKKQMDFQTPENVLGVVSRRDSLQHPFFEQLFDWGKSSRYYAFGTSLGKDEMILRRQDSKIAVSPSTDQNKVIEIFRRGLMEYKKRFKDAIKKDMAKVGYEIDDVGLIRPTSVNVNVELNPALELACLYVKEKSLRGITEQPSMSQGMFRAFSLIIQLNYSQFAAKPSCIVVDDIGEGLDFDRSCALINLLIAKTENSTVQLIMATNDRFVMNRVPLESWSVIRRVGNRCEYQNYSNSKKKFDEFKFTGLNNFDFLTTDFLNESEAS